MGHVDFVRTHDRHRLALARKLSWRILEGQEHGTTRIHGSAGLK